MTLPEYIEAYDAPTGSGEPKGIIDQIRGNVTNSNILNFVVPTTSGKENLLGNKNNPITLANGFWQGCEATGYYQIEFKDRYVFLTNYSLKGWPGGYSKEWDMYGFNSDEEPTLLSSDTSVGSTYCGGAAECNCEGKVWGTFEIKNTPKKAYRFFRIMHPKYEYFIFSGIEFFGIFSTNGAMPRVKKKNSRCYKSIPLGFRIQNTLLLMILVCLS